MRRVSRPAQAFTLVELLVVLGIIVVLAALLFPALASAKAKGKRTVCINNLKQVNLAVRMYAEDHDDTIELPTKMVMSPVDYHLFKEQVKRYLALSGPPSRSESIFACPADTFYYSAGGYRAAGLHEQAWSDFTSYAFNGMNRRGTNTETGVALPGIAGKRLVSVREPSKTVLVAEAAALTPYSWHSPARRSGEFRFQDSRNALSFVDGHVNYVRMYWSGTTNSEAWHYDPPIDYDYKWSDR